MLLNLEVHALHTHASYLQSTQTTHTNTSYNCSGVEVGIAGGKRSVFLEKDKPDGFKWICFVCEQQVSQSEVRPPRNHANPHMPCNLPVVSYHLTEFCFVSLFLLHFFFCNLTQTPTPHQKALLRCKSCDTVVHAHCGGRTQDCPPNCVPEECPYMVSNSNCCSLFSVLLNHPPLILFLPQALTLNPAPLHMPRPTQAPPS